MGHFVEYVGQVGGVVLADSEDNGLANFPADGVAQGIFEKSLAEKHVGGVGKESLLELALFVGFVVILALGIGERNDEALLREELCCHIGAGINNGWVDQDAIFYAIE